MIRLDDRRARIRRGGLAALLLGTSACLVGPDYETPESGVNESYVESADPRVKPHPVNAIDWWKTFNDPLLDELVQEAFAQNLTLRQAGLRVVQAMAERGIAVGEFFPQSQAIGGGFTRTKDSENPPNPEPYFNTYDVGFDAAWELDLWGKFRRNLETADAVLEASLASYDDVMVSLVAEVAATYIDVRTLQVLIEIEEENVKIQERSLELAESRFRNGQTSELDVADAKSVLAQTRALVPGQRAALRQAMYQLSFLLGQPPTDLAQRLGDAKEIPTAPAEIAVGLPADLLRRRPDIRLAERTAAARSAQIGLAEAALYPAFSLAGSIGLRSDESGDLLETDSWTGSISPGFSWPILNYGRLENNVRVQDALFQSAILDYQNAVLAAAQEVEGALAEFLTSQEQVKYYQESVTASERSLELSTIRYKEGSSTFTRVLDAQEQLRQTQESLVNAQGSVAQSLIATYKALGGGWEVSRPVDLLPEETRREMEERTDWGGYLDEAGTGGADASHGDDLTETEPARAPTADAPAQEPVEPDPTQGKEED